MQKKKPTKQIILFTVAIILLLLIIFAKDIIKLTNKNKIGLLENTPNEITLVEPNVPVISAGMIPVKWNGTNWIITTVEDKDWYDYKNGKSAYIMLNDGYYQSELLRDMTNKELAENNVGNDAVVVPNVPNNNPSILIWIPRFAYNENGDIKYIKDVESADENWTIPEIFACRQAETMPDFLLTGIWFEIDVDTAYSTKIAQMNQEESIYGFIKNTIAVSSDQPTQNAIQTYINKIDANVVGATSVRNTQENLPNVALTPKEYLSTVGNDATVVPSITDSTNPNRIILKIINQNNQEPIKAKASYNKELGKIDVQVTYSQYGIEKILYEDTQELKLTQNGNKVTATSEGLNIKYGTAKLTIIDNKGNRKELEIGITSKVYVTLYTDGTLGFCSNNSKIAGKIVSQDYGDITGKEYDGSTIPWKDKTSNITTVEFVNEISPISTSFWFYHCNNLTTINNIENMNTINVTNMSSMFRECISLTSIDVSNFDTSNVTNMNSTFYGCSGLTELDLSNFDTSNVTNMLAMFFDCTSLRKLDLSSFDTRNVTRMAYMFTNCTSLTSVDVSSFDTSNVINMDTMFNNCTSLTELDVSNFNTSNVTNMIGMFQNCTSLTTLDLSSFDTSNVTTISGIFYNCASLKQITFGEKWKTEITLPIPRKTCTGWYSDANFTTKVANVGANYTPNGPITIYTDVVPDIFVTLYTDGTLAFAETRNPFPEKTIAVKYEDVSEREGTNLWTDFPWYDQRESVTTVDFVDKISPISTSSWFAECKNLTQINHIENLDTSKVIKMNYMFYGCHSLTELDLSSFDTSKVTTMSSMFNWCPNLTKINVSSFNTSNVTEMYLMFSTCENLKEIDVSNFNTSKVTDMEGMFLNCKSLTQIDVSNFNVSNVIHISRLFLGCSNLTKIDISNFNKGNSSTKNVINMYSMFQNCTNLKDLNLGNLNTSNVTNMQRMFQDCTSLTELDLSSFNTMKVTNMNWMFNNCTNLKTIYVGTNWRLASNRTDIFTGCGTSTTTRK